MLSWLVRDSGGEPIAEASVRLDRDSETIEVGVTDESGVYTSSESGQVDLVLGGEFVAALAAGEDREVDLMVPVILLVDAEVVPVIPSGEKWVNLNLTVENGAGGTVTVILENPGKVWQKYNLATVGANGVTLITIPCESEFSKITLVVEKVGMTRLTVSTNLTWASGGSACPITGVRLSTE